MIATPGLTAITDLVTARRVHVADSLMAVPQVERYPGPVVDVGSGGGAPGFPLASALPGHEVTLLEASSRKCAFLERWAAEFSNVRVVHGRAEEQEPEQFGVAVAKALAPPAVAAEWCLGLAAPGGVAILYVGPTADVEHVASVAEQLGGASPEVHAGLLVIPKLRPLPPGFPRRVGVARKRPLT